MKKILFFAAALAALASCTSEDFTGDQSLKEANEQAPISFGFDVPTATRASGAEAATKLNNQFIVWGEKGEVNTGAIYTADDAGANTHQLVFQNYVVNYVSNSAYTTTSNTKDWEYVGYKFDDASVTISTDKYSTNVTPNSGTVDQTIKYWDYAASSYTFTAVSAKPADITAGKVKVKKLTSGSSVYDKGYEVDVTEDADLTSLYFADRVNIAQSNDKDRTQSNKYGGHVKFTFRNAISQVRVGMYETISGYDVKVTKFYYADAAAPAFTAMTTENTANFVANIPNVSPASGKTSVPGKFTVKYYPQSTANDAAHITNHPTISFTADPATGKKNYLSLGSGVYNTTLAVTSAAPTYDQTGGAYTTVFPQEDNSTNLKLKIDYQLSNTVTGEIINITGKTAEVPAQYLQWKPNYKYTYLFKISDNDLYPITFDAVVIEAEDGQVEYITTVSEPSITTYAKGSAVTVNGEYKDGELIYAVVEDGSSLATLSASNMKLYTVTTSDATNFPITEASVAEAIAEYPIMTTAEQTAAKIKFTATSFTDYGKTVVAEDGSTVEMHATNNVVASFTGAAITTPDPAPQYYAIEFIKTPATYGNDGGKTYGDAAAFAAAGTLYSDAACTTVADSWTNGTTYYKKTHVTAVGTYAYKIVKVVPQP